MPPRFPRKTGIAGIIENWLPAIEALEQEYPERYLKHQLSLMFLKDTMRLIMEYVDNPQAPAEAMLTSAELRRLADAMDGLTTPPQP